MQVYVLFEWINDGWDHGYWEAVAVKTNFDDAEEWEKKNWDERKVEQFQLDVL